MATIFPGLGLYWFSDTDPSIAPGVSAPFGQLLFRTDAASVYYKAGPNPVDWESLSSDPSSVIDTATGGGIYGDGSDGDLVFDGINTVAGIEPDAGWGVAYGKTFGYRMVRDTFARNCRINPNIIVLTAGNRMFVQETMIIEAGAEFGARGRDAALQAGGDYSPFTGGSWDTGKGGGNGGFFFQLATNGTACSQTIPRVGVGSSSDLGGLVPGASGLDGDCPMRGGGGGGGMHAADYGPGKSGGTITPWDPINGFGYPGLYWGRSSLGDKFIAGGSGGGGGGQGTDGSAFGGGGGGGGGSFWLAAKKVYGPGIISGKGGLGADARNLGAANGAGGGGGGGGFMAFFYNSTEVTPNLSGGSGGNGLGGGGPGGSGADGLMYNAPGWAPF